MLRTHTCGELRRDNVDQTVTISGWVNNYRDFGEHLLFVDVRDRYGKTQVVFNTQANATMGDVARKLRKEDVVQITGRVKYRGDELVNPKLETGEIEVVAEELTVFSKSRTPPFEPETTELPNEELRLSHRFVDLRRPAVQRNIILRHKLTQSVREYFNGLDFLEIETPMLGRSTPEGARDYLVPSRVHPGSFYALPQSPQIYKQILMVSGFDRYYQIARCFRDEDLRADRQPEFTQIDVEMAFVDREDVLSTIGGLVSHVLKDVTGKELAPEFPRFTHAEVMEKYGSDKPDLRFEMELVDVGDIVRDSEFGVFSKTIEGGGRVRGLNAKGGADKYSRKGIDGLTKFIADYGAKGLAFFKVKEGKLESSIAKFFNEEQLAAIKAAFSAEDGDLLLFVADQPSVTSAALAALRGRLGKELEMYDPGEFHCSWVVDFPLVTWNEDAQRYDAEHHPFCSIHPDDVDKLESDPAAVRALSYDLVVNGYEAASGSIRIHDSAVQQTVFDMLNINAEEAEARFGFLLQSLRYGAPPHGGIALGVDRLIALLCGADSIRDVVAFPKTAKGSCLMTESPAAVEPRQLRDLHIDVKVAKKAE